MQSIFKLGKILYNYIRRNIKKINKVLSKPKVNDNSIAYGQFRKAFLY